MGIWIPGGLEGNETPGPGPEPYVPPTWADGTDAEIVEALEKHYNNEIDLTEYWSVGDERVISLSAMAKYSSGMIMLSDTHVAQDIVMVILNIGGKELVTPINGHTECAFVVGQKDCLKETGTYNSTASSDSIQQSGWSSSVRRSWANTTYRNAFPSTIKNIFKYHINYTADNAAATSLTSSNDYFCLPTSTEASSVISIESTKNNKFEYYRTTANRVKKLGTGSATEYFTSSKYMTSNSSYKKNMVYIKTTNSTGNVSCTSSKALAPQGVI